MDLWIRSQDRTHMELVTWLTVKKNAKLKWYIEGGEILGYYKTKERALEVLDQIERLIFTRMKIENMDYESADIQVKGQILCNMTKIYDMPKE